VPDVTIFERSTWDRDAIARRLRELAAITPRWTAILHGEAFRCPDGLADHVRYLAADTREPICIDGVEGETSLQSAFRWTDSSRTTICGFVGRDAVASGAHVDGFFDGLLDAFIALDRERFARVQRSAFRELVEPGLVAAVRVSIEDPRYRTIARDRLWNPEVQPAVAAMIAPQFRARLLADHALRERLLARLA
jgi:DNA gyrase/topoisomerase IV subunit B